MWVRERGVAGRVRTRAPGRAGTPLPGEVSALECETLVRGMARLLLAAVIAGLGAERVDSAVARNMRSGRSWSAQRGAGRLPDSIVHYDGGNGGGNKDGGASVGGAAAAAAAAAAPTGAPQARGAVGQGGLKPADGAEDETSDDSDSADART